MSEQYRPGPSVELSYILPPSISENDILDYLGSAYNIEPGGKSTKNRCYFDTFDFRLYRKGMRLTKEGNSYCLYNPDSENPSIKIPCRSAANPRFSRDFPEGDMKDTIAQRIEARALLHQATVSERVVTHRLLNSDNKTVLFLKLIHIELGENGTGGGSGKIVRLIPVRGYDEDFDKARLHIEGRGLDPSDKGVFDIVLVKTGKNPDDYTSKLDIVLDPEMSPREAFRVILLDLMDTMQRNETGIIDDIDIEFLHDYRVSVRRARSLLSLIKDVVPSDMAEGMKNELRQLGKATNRLRDLDIYILKREEYMAMVPEELRPGLEPLFDLLQRDRQDAHAKLSGYLTSKSYAEKISFLTGCINRNNPSEASDILHESQANVYMLARAAIWKRYRKVVKQGKLITDQSHDTELHSLRIECKKLRYSLEFFSSLFPEGDMKVLVKQLKKLQDNLGDFNDLHVQQQRLKGFLKELESDSGGYEDTLLSVGGLISVLFQKQMSVRRKFSARFKEFRKKKNKNTFRRLFSEDRS